MPIPLTFPGDAARGYLAKETEGRTERTIAGWIGASTPIQRITLVTLRPDVFKKHKDKFYQPSQTGFKIVSPNDKSPLISFGDSPKSYCAHIELTLNSGQTIASQEFAIYTLSPDKFLLPDVPFVVNIAHSKWIQHLVQNYDHPGVEILEVGSRKVTHGNAKSFFTNNFFIVILMPGYQKKAKFVKFV